MIWICNYIYINNVIQLLMQALALTAEPHVEVRAWVSYYVQQEILDVINSPLMFIPLVIDNILNTS